jgi:hypothetical protein
MMNFQINTPTPIHAIIISPETIPPPFEVLSFNVCHFSNFNSLNNFFSCNKLVVPQIYLLVQIKKLFFILSNLIYSKKTF